MNRLLGTGASGFIGHALVALLSKQREFWVRATTRGKHGTPMAGVEPIVVAPLGPDAVFSG